jgi:hypothetical protein
MLLQQFFSLQPFIFPAQQSLSLPKPPTSKSKKQKTQSKKPCVVLQQVFYTQW